MENCDGMLELGEEANGLAGWGFGAVEVENGLWLELAEDEKAELKRLLPRSEGVVFLLDGS